MRTPGQATIRPATPADADALAVTHLACWRETYTGVIPKAVFEERAATMPEKWRSSLADPDGSTIWLAVRDGEVLGFSGADAVGPGEVRSLRLSTLYLRAAEHGSGLGQALFDVAVGDAPCFCWVAEANARAIAFYRRNGLLPDGARHLMEQWGDLPIIRLVR